MKVSRSVLCSVVAAAYAVAHLAFLAPSLEDIDSINFALGLRDFDVARHQPHPPGYPVYIAFGRISRAAIGAVAPDLPPVRAEATALAIWSAVGGAVALLAACALFRRLAEVTGRDDSDAAPLLATLLLAAAPLFWMSGLRPMSDVPGLAAALTAQALTMAAWRHRLFLIPAALVAGLAIGIRIQTIWLTAPLLTFVMFRHRVAGVRLTLGAGVIGSLVWAIPLVMVSGGFDAYLRALGSQAGEDFAWVDMLWANPAPRRVAFALYETLVMPWGSLPLAAIVGVAAAIGAVVALARARLPLALICVAFLPYAAFHLLFQETVHVRYALPVVPAIAWLAAQAAVAVGRVGAVAAVALALFALISSAPAMIAYAREPHPAFVAIEEMSRAVGSEHPAALFGHYAVRRPLQAQPPAGVKFVEPPRASEWAGPIEYWRGGGTDPVWFLADPRRTDLALIDPQSRRSVRRYQWSVADRMELSGVRPTGVDWYRLQDPGWFAGQGWSLTPELGGVVRLAGTGVDRRPIDAYVRRRDEPMIAVVGARHLGTRADGVVAFTMTIDGSQVASWALDPAVSLNALQVVELPAGRLHGPGAYARLTISARDGTGAGPTPPVAIRQFDIQPATSLVHAFDEGWHEEEFENATGLRWRWSSGRSVLRVLPPQAVTLRLRGESPLRYFDAPPRVRVVAGGRVIAERRPDDDFDWTVTVPAADVRNGDGRIAVETDPVYLPGRAEGTTDERQLGVRLFTIDVIQVSP